MLTSYPKAKLEDGQVESFHRSVGKRRASHQNSEHELEVSSDKLWYYAMRPWGRNKTTDSDGCMPVSFKTFDLLSYYNILLECFLRVKSRGKVPSHAMMAYNGTGHLVPLTLNLGTRKRRVGSCLSKWLYTRRNSSWYTLMRRLVGPQSQSWFLETKEISWPLLGFEPQIIWSFTKPLYWLCCTGCVYWEYR
jgi:hypothetical protein